ncbi:hypothetical protein L21SP2_2294 [Salinispira pacifica]|uniref:Uncharacterized protein n=1 Tax=Salinispira pacifica TaxID=1307761 RepID=V5WKD2_9SPIO|nr:hypothetical protein L21SP2_2294 [Salinispira pacifica]
MGRTIGCAAEEKSSTAGHDERSHAERDARFPNISYIHMNIVDH